MLEPPVVGGCVGGCKATPESGAVLSLERQLDVARGPADQHKHVARVHLPPARSPVVSFHNPKSSRHFCQVLNNMATAGIELQSRCTIRRRPLCSRICSSFEFWGRGKESSQVLEDLDSLRSVWSRLRVEALSREVDVPSAGKCHADVRPDRAGVGVLLRGEEVAPHCVSEAS